MLPHVFSYAGATYVVSFKRIDDQWRAALYGREDSSVRVLSSRMSSQELSGFSDQAIRAGYIGVAEWLVKCQVGREAVGRFGVKHAA